jgi:hypothetical protein
MRRILAIALLSLVLPCLVVSQAKEKKEAAGGDAAAIDAFYWLGEVNKASAVTVVGS